MTKFIQYFNICPIHDPKEFLGIAPDKDDDHIITTLSKNVVIIIKISTQKQIRSWSVLEKLSAKVVYDKQTQKYVGVFGNTVVRCWDAETGDVNKCKKLKFHRHIADLVSKDGEVFVIYSDGGYELLANAIESRKENLSNAVHHHVKIQHSQVFCLSDGRKILTYFEKVTRGGTKEVVTLVRHSLQDTGNPIRLQLMRNDSPVSLLGYTVVEGDTDPVLLTIWSDKRMFAMKLDDFVTSDQRPGNYVSMMTAIKADGPVSVVGITSNFIAVYGASANSEGSSLLLYNTQFKVVKAKQFFKVYFKFSHLWSIGNHILLAMGQNLSVVSYNMSRDVLSELLGAQLHNDYFHPLEGDQINEEEPLEEALSYGGALLEARVGREPARASRSGELVEADGKHVPFASLESFDQSLSALYKHYMLAECCEDPSLDKDIGRVVLMPNSDDTGFQQRPIEMLAQQMERCGASEHEISEKLLTVLIRGDMLPDIIVCLRRYTNIPEKMLARVLLYVLKEIERGQLKKTYAAVEEKTRPQPEVGAKLERFEADDTKEFPIVDILAQSSNGLVGAPQEPLFTALDTVLTSSFDEATITHHLRKQLTYSSVVYLLDYIYEELTQPSSGPESSAAGLGSGTDYELQLLRWFGILLNSHFQQLTLAGDIQLVETLLKWNELFLAYRNQIDDLQEVAAALYKIIQRKRLVKEKNYSKWYFIEEVQLF